jgi:hypothetical protein
VDFRQYLDIKRRRFPEFLAAVARDVLEWNASPLPRRKDESAGTDAIRKLLGKALAVTCCWKRKQHHDIWKCKLKDTDTLPAVKTAEDSRS